MSGALRGDSLARNLDTRLRSNVRSGLFPALAIHQTLVGDYREMVCHTCYLVGYKLQSVVSLRQLAFIQCCPKDLTVILGNKRKRFSLKSFSTGLRLFFRSADASAFPEDIHQVMDNFATHQFEFN